MLNDFYLKEYSIFRINQALILLLQFMLVYRSK